MKRGRGGIEWLHGNAHFRERPGLTSGGKKRVAGGVEQLRGSKTDA